MYFPEYSGMYLILRSASVKLKDFLKRSITITNPVKVSEINENFEKENKDWFDKTIAHIPAKLNFLISTVYVDNTSNHGWLCKASRDHSGNYGKLSKIPLKQIKRSLTPNLYVITSNNFTRWEILPWSYSMQIRYIGCDLNQRYHTLQYNHFEIVSFISPLLNLVHCM